MRKTSKFSIKSGLPALLGEANSLFNQTTLNHPQLSTSAYLKMEPATSAAIRAIWAAVHSPSSLPFPQTVTRLLALNVSRYHIDYTAMTATAYVGSSIDVAPLPLKISPQSVDFPKWNGQGVRDAIKGAQSGELKYHDFAKKVVEAGTTNYWAFLDGTRVLYMGGNG